MLSFILYHWGPPKMWNWNQIWANHFGNLAIFLLLGFSSSLLWFERRYMIYIFLNVSKFFFYSPKCDPRPMWARECVSVLVGWTAPQMSIASSWLMVLLSSIMSLLIFCRLDLGTSAKRSVDFTSEAVDSSVFPCSAISFCLVLWYSIVRHTHVKDYYIFLAHRLLYHYTMFLITLIIFFSLKSSFFEINIVISSFF